MTLKRLSAQVRSITDLSPTAREVTLSLSEPLGFISGAFVNVFLKEGETKMRRAYSISSSEQLQNEISLSIRKGSEGGMSEKFFNETIRTTPLEIVGPLGLNLVSQITKNRVFLFGFGIGVSVVKGLAEALLAREQLQELTIVTGSRSEEEVLYRSFFEALQKADSRVMLRFVISQPHDVNYPYRGHIQDHINDYDISNATAYVCGSKKACEDLRERIEKKNTGVEFFLEAFE